MLGPCVADAIRRYSELRYGPPEIITRAWTNRPYLTRWTVANLGNGRKVLLHRFRDSDADEPHDHPWPFASLILAGGYWERTPGRGWKDGSGPIREQWFGPGRWLIRPADWIHAVRLPGPKDNPRECWTLLYTGVKVRPWGFWCPVGGWVPWRVHLASFYKTGNGCGG